MLFGLFVFGISAVISVNIDLYSHPIALNDKDYLEINQIRKYGNHLALRMERIGPIYEKHLGLALDPIEIILKFTGSDTQDLFWTPEKCKSAAWVYFGEQLNIVNLFKTESFYGKLNILMTINRWLIKMENLYPIERFPNKRYALLVVGGWLRAMAEHVELNSNLTDNLLVNVINNSFFQSHSEYIIPKKSLYLYCQYHLDNFSELHQSIGMEESINLVVKGPFSNELPSLEKLEEWASIGKYYKKLGNFLERAGNSDMQSF